MTSLRGKLVRILIANKHLLKGKLKREVIDSSTSIEKLRNDIKTVAEKISKLPRGVKVTTSEFDKFYSEWIIPENCDENKVILYFHGGGFIAGSSEDHRTIVANFAKRCQVKCLVFNYSLAPEKPFPAAIMDSIDIYSWLLEIGYCPKNIMFAGESAGGGLEISTVLMLKEMKIRLPKAIVAISPCADMTCSGKSNTTKKYIDPCIPIGANEIYTDYYTGNHDPKDPIISPIFADFTGICPIMIQVGTDEILLDDSIRLAKKAEEDGVDISIHVWERMFHCFTLLSSILPEADDSMEEICQFISKHLLYNIN
ncbi:alpha/beta hydrolase [Romboutsia lituseburensis]|uniref:Acetyl esterase/lipase n=1 Tax=Romboutsia lituseburensis DSM 797 TaxID=1121325 RepID=A0A1G9K7R3_9FIRM|nr:alpha/beta hydrolase [Romboutsia lituseburensis]CEH34800.1 Esterase [Romboutsia lituseburensis]SDL45778.1 Acetyl esterase/lipase [Romboutsia lituseburensis DSM 797]